MAKDIFFILSMCGLSFLNASESVQPGHAATVELNEMATLELALKKAYLLDARYKEQQKDLWGQTWAAFLGNPSTALNSNTAFDAQGLSTASFQEENRLKIADLEQRLAALKK